MYLVDYLTVFQDLLVPEEEEFYQLIKEGDNSVSNLQPNLLKLNRLWF